MFSSLWFIGDEITIRGLLWGIPSVGVVTCLGLGFWGLFNRWWPWLSFGLMLAGFGLVLLNARVWLDVISLKDLMAALGLLLGGYTLLTKNYHGW
ncbi:MAG: hypothetical protein HC921_15305 [Synechococcaceae cyanobacterium SM2_3_1]|nr:hypothetical protein [Synechococcaceae cyanobacterium SM2_3_1]